MVKYVFNLNKRLKDSIIDCKFVKCYHMKEIVHLFTVVPEEIMQTNKRKLKGKAEHSELKGKLLK